MSNDVNCSLIQEWVLIYTDCSFSITLMGFFLSSIRLLSQEKLLNTYGVFQLCLTLVQCSLLHGSLKKSHIIPLLYIHALSMGSWDVLIPQAKRFMNSSDSIFSSLSIWPAARLDDFSPCGFRQFCTLFVVLVSVFVWVYVCICTD